MTLAIMLESRSIPTHDVSVTTEMAGEKLQDLHITHSIKVMLYDDVTAEQKEKARELISAADASCMIGNLLKGAGVKISVAGEIILSTVAR